MEADGRDEGEEKEKVMEEEREDAARKEEERMPSVHERQIEHDARSDPRGPLYHESEHLLSRQSPPPPLFEDSDEVEKTLRSHWQQQQQEEEEEEVHEGSFRRPPRTLSPLPAPSRRNAPGGGRDERGQLGESRSTLADSTDFSREKEGEAVTEGVGAGKQVQGVVEGFAQQQQQQQEGQQ
mmetsp:Transcript_21740/g.43215  ORF Transcript_21740/g.43215 Transcript_21740/m.43215 type:complete len:181 (-) Transcript_21740:870-1412(-)